MLPIIGSTVTNYILKHTFYKQFCAGANENDIQPILHKMKDYGVGFILDYAAEAEEDIVLDAKSGSSSSSHSTAMATTASHDIVTHPPFNQPARIYEYKSEQKCDHHVDIFLKCIHAVKQSNASSISSSNSNSLINIDNASAAKLTSTSTKPGFAAIKVTALGNPLLLERMSNAINEASNLFSKFDHDNDGIMTRNEFKKAYTLFFNDHNGTSTSASTNTSTSAELQLLLDEELDPNYENQIDYITFMSKLVSPTNLQRLCQNCKNIGPLSLATPSNEEIDLMHKMHERAHILAKEAFTNNVRLLIDAEQYRYQPAIDYLALELQRTYNDKDKTDVPIIFNTYQCYLKDVVKRIDIDLERSKRYNYHFGAKLVRGAYMVSENARANEMNIESPIHASIEETHLCYNNIVNILLREKVKDDSLVDTLEIMCATHNQESIEKVLDLLTELNLNGNDIHFAQLYGMSDNLTYPLGEYKYPAYKYVPYGQMDEVMPYLLRRAQENSDVIGKENAKNELKLLFGELKRRFR
jgi:proline dehydrogenase